MKIDQVSNNRYPWRRTAAQFRLMTAGRLRGFGGVHPTRVGAVAMTIKYQGSRSAPRPFVSADRSNEWLDQ